MAFTRFSLRVALTRTVIWLNRGARLLLVLVILHWLAALVLTDRYGWSQWLKWTSFTPIALAASGALALICRPGVSQRMKRRMRLLWSGVFLAMLIHFTMWEHQFLRYATPAPPTNGGFVITHWNAWPASPSHLDRYADGLLEAAGDLIILTEGRGLPWHPRVSERLGEDGVRFARYPFAVLGRVRIVSHRMIMAQDDVYVLAMEVDALPDLGRPLVVYAVDLPSDLSLSRITVARTVRRLLDKHDIPSPDVVVGDFNITRGSASLRLMFPNMRHAYDEAGRGWGATYHVNWPLLHIDHILLGESVRATRYELTNPRVGRHLIQRATIHAVADGEHR
jgi:hypothetical protein